MVESKYEDIIVRESQNYEKSNLLKTICFVNLETSGIENNLQLTKIEELKTAVTEKFGVISNIQSHLDENCSFITFEERSGSDKAFGTLRGKQSRNEFIDWYNSQGYIKLLLKFSIISVSEFLEKKEIKEEYLEETKNKWQEEQLRLKENMILEDNFDFTFEEEKENTIKYIGGVDISFIRDNKEDACASLVVLEYPSLKIVYEAFEMVKLDLPYISSYLGFREVPHLEKLVEKMKSEHSAFLPQLIMVDGNGYLHPRGFGLACHLGVLTGIPTLGIGKTLLHVDGIELKTVKQQFKENCKIAGDKIDLIGQSGTIWGVAFKSTKDSTNPLFISCGHKISLNSAVNAVSKVSKFRVPEPVRQADLRSRDKIREIISQK